MNKTELKGLVGLDKTDELIEKLRRLAADLGDKYLENDVVMQSAKWENYKRQRAQGVLDNESLRLMKAQLDDALLYIIDKLPDSAVAASTNKDKPGAAATSGAVPVQPLSPSRYLSISAVALLMAIGLFMLLAFFQDGLSSKLGDQAYYLLLFPLAFSTAAFLFGAMRTYAAYSHTVNNQAIELGGPIVAAVMVVVGGFFLVPESEPFGFTIHLVSDKNRPEFDEKFPGSLKLKLDDVVSVEEIDKDGAIDFKGIPPKFDGMETPVELNLNGWQFADSHHNLSKVKLLGKSADLKIERDGSLAKVFGAVRDNNDNFLAGVLLSIGQLTVLSDSLGRFEINIPEDQQQRTQKLQASKKGYQIWEHEVIPETKEKIEIQLISKQ